MYPRVSMDHRSATRVHRPYISIFNSYAESQPQNFEIYIIPTPPSFSYLPITI